MEAVGTGALMWAGGGEKRPIKTWKPVELGKERIRESEQGPTLNSSS